MRLDLYLRISGLIRKRSLAQRACRSGFVAVEGRGSAKPSSDVREGDVLLLGGRSPDSGVRRRIRIVAIPEGQVSRKQRRSLYEEIEGTGAED